MMPLTGHILFAPPSGSAIPLPVIEITTTIEPDDMEMTARDDALTMTLDCEAN